MIIGLKMILALLLTVFVVYGENSSYQAEVEAYLAAQNISVVGVPSTALAWSVGSEFSSDWIVTSDTNFDISLQVKPQSDTSTWPEAGLYYTVNREEENGVYVSLSVLSQTGVTLKSNGNENQNHELASSSTINLPLWLRLTKTEGSLKGYYKQRENDDWIELGDVSVGDKVGSGLAKIKYKPQF